MYIKRILSSTFIKAVSGMPAVLVTGPRQSGKTTFLKNETPEGFEYVSFDDPLNRQTAMADPAGFLKQLQQERVVLDEIQYVPELFPYIKMAIDSAPGKNGRWIMTGSQQFSVMKNISESLAGRVAILNLLPFHTLERINGGESLENLIWNGGYPGIITGKDIRDIWLPSYISTYIERDVRQIINVQDINQFQTFTSLCAASHGQELNMASLSRSCGLSQPTCKRWISILSSSFIIMLVKPYFKNLGKRQIKAPKLYFLDSAIANHLTRQPSKDAALAGSMGGAFFEGFVITETHKILTSVNRQHDIFFWRSHGGLEVDMILIKDGITHAVEIKKTSTPKLRHGDNLVKFAELSGIQDLRMWLVTNSERRLTLPSGVEVLPWNDYLEMLAD